MMAYYWPASFTSIDTPKGALAKVISNAKPYEGFMGCSFEEQFAASVEKMGAQT